ncbi:MAG: formate/nitrite transporter family protein [Candidatus Rokubacteria bacterium]|nr:formate/nitrite transporter family protein [Candidatus Rokubacteria bacterium]
MGLLIAAFDPGFALSRGLEPQAAALSVAGFLWRNLLPVTLGNVIGGVVMVGAGYWFVYLRPRAGR